VLKIFKKGKGLATLALLASLIIGILGPAGAALASPNAQVDLTTAQHELVISSGDTFQVPVHIDTGSNLISGTQIKMNFNSAVVHCTGATLGNFKPAGTGYNALGSITDIDNVSANGSTGAWGWAATSSPPISGPGTLITFDFVAVANGTAAISYNPVSCQFSDENLIAFTVFTDGDINVTVGAPDLTVTAQSETWVTQGSTYTVAFTAKNQGDAALTATYDWEIKVDNVVVDTGTGTAMAAGGSETITSDPVTLNGGMDTVVVTLDPANTITEKLETNNSMTKVWSLLVLGIDAPASINVGQTFTATVNVSTLDSKTRGAQGKFTFDPAKLECTGVDEGTFYSAWASANGASTQFLAGTIDNATGAINGYGVSVLGGNINEGPAGSGSFLVLSFRAKAASTGSSITPVTGSAILDVAGNELPGLSLMADSITISAVQGYDFTIGPAQVQMTTVDNKAAFNVIYRVNNIGGAATAEISNVGILVNGELLEAIPTAKLAAGANAEAVSGPWKLSDLTPASTYHVVVEADYYNNNPKELNENNNTWETTLPTLPDYIVATKLETQTAPGVYTISGVIMNIGAATTKTSITRVLVDNITVADISTPGLASGATATYTVTNVNLTNATDTVKVAADALGDIVESNENNNVRTNTYVPSNEDGDTIIVGEIVPQIEITVPQDIPYFTLELGLNEASGTLNVKSNGNWQVETSDDNQVTHGYLTEWDNNYGTTQLTDPMTVSYGSTDVPLPGPGIIATGTPAGQFLDDGEDFDIVFSQFVYYSDPIGIYRIVVTFTAGISF
jgi:subtilase family serine protease